MSYTVYQEWVGVVPANRVTKETGIWMPLFITLYCDKGPLNAGFRRAVQRGHETQLEMKKVTKRLARE